MSLPLLVIQNVFNKKNFKKLIFVLLSTQLLYLTIHLQFLLGMPQAGLAVADSLFFLFVGIGLYILSKGNKKQYFIGFAVILWPTVIIQYFYIKIFNKPFLLSEMSKFITLLQVSPWILKISYTVSFITWCLGLIYTCYFSIKNWFSITVIKKIIPILILIFYSYHFTHKVPVAFWRVDPTMTFFAKGILVTIRSNQIEDNIDLDPVGIKNSFDYLRQKEQHRTRYPISASPDKVPSKKRPVFMFVFESFYDYKHFLPVFKEDPFPKEYREFIKQNNYTGPNQASGSFDARFVSLTGSIPFSPPSRILDFPYQTLPHILSDYGYETIALESVNPTYSLPTYYKLWGFKKVFFELFGNDWQGNRISVDTYEKNITKIISETPNDITPFYFGFTFLGHGNTCQFTERIPDPDADISSYLQLFKPNEQKRAKQLLKANIFNAKRFVSIKNMILNKYPEALIVLKVDHYSTELYQSINSDNNLPEEYKNNFKTDPNVLPFIVIDGTNGALPLEAGFSPANIPLLILAESGLPYKNTTASLLFRDTPTNTITIYNKWYIKQNEKYLLLEVSANSNQNLLEYNQAIQTVSQDLYKNKEPSVTLNLLNK